MVGIDEWVYDRSNWTITMIAFDIILIKSPLLSDSSVNSDLKSIVGKNFPGSVQQRIFESF